MKIVFALLWSAFCLVLALVPEIAMYLTYSLINPETTLAKVAVMALFWFGGAGLCVFSGVLGFALWVAGLDAGSKNF